MSSRQGCAGNFRVLAELLWLAVPAQAAVCLVAWHQLPEQLATHFDFENRPNGWMPRPAWLLFTLAVTALVTASATWRVKRIEKPDPAAWSLLGIFYCILGTLVWVTHGVIEFNAGGRSLQITPAIAVAMVATALLAMVAVTTRRGTKLPVRTIFADEVHQSAAWGILLAAPSVAFTILASKIPVTGLRLALGLSIALMLAGAAFAWSGFHYIFSPAGVEIRTLGFRLRSIPASHIATYAVDQWNALGGYGIRGVGERRAYVWGNRGVRIQTSEGEIFLGHSQPERILHDLDLVVRDRALDNDKF